MLSWLKFNILIPTYCRHMRAAADRKRLALANRRAVEMSLEGRKMAL